MAAFSSASCWLARILQLVGALLVLALTVGLVLARPRIGSLGSLHPAISAVIGAMALFALGHLRVHDVIGTARDLWRPATAFNNDAAISSPPDGITRGRFLDRYGSPHGRHHSPRVPSCVSAP